MDPVREHELLLSRRFFLGQTTVGLGTAALATLLGAGDARGETDRAERNRGGSHRSPASQHDVRFHGVLRKPHVPPTAKRVIYLFMAGAPSQLDTFDYKPKLEGLFDTDLPDSVRMGQRLTTMTSGQKRFPIAPSMFQFRQYGQSGAWVSELLPHTAAIVDELAIIKTVYTEAINHDPAITYIQTGAQRPGRPSLGAWLSYGLGSMNENLPTFVVLFASWTGRKEAQALFSRLWGSSFLPTRHAGIALRSKGDPVLYLSDPPGVDRSARRDMLDAVVALNKKLYQAVGDPEITTRIAQYEMAFRMQRS
ncbi:MAG TPA: DUF1501 domain-containing protein, partial [Planctomycetaceae bacterium]|nr:DUF1501 domain-containing protein [Planctomycetaceae bacterium]